jgi:hypothetical protein
MPIGLTDVQAIAAGENHCLALTSDGTIVTWGGDDSAQADVPPGLGKVTSLGAGWNYSVALIGSVPSPFGLTLSSASWDADGFSVSVETQTKKSYILQYKTSLTDANWIALPSTPGTGGLVRLIDSSPTNSHRIYRVQEL